MCRQIYNITFYLVVILAIFFGIFHLIYPYDVIDIPDSDLPPRGKLKKKKKINFFLSFFISNIKESSNKLFRIWKQIW